MALLNVDKLSVHFGDEGTPFRAVDRISYSVNQGEVVGIVGESGSGKSVSSLAIMGLIDYPGRVMAESPSSMVRICSAFPKNSAANWWERKWR